MESGNTINPAIKRVVVTGGSGFIGAHLLRSLTSQGIAVVNIDLLPGPAGLSTRISAVQCDIRRPLSTPPAEAVGADVLVHVAAIAREPGFPAEAYAETNVTGTANVLEWCTRAGINRLWFISSMSVYGPSETPLTETSELRPRTPYGRSKLDAEHLVCQWVDADPDRDAIILRPAVVFGPGEKGNFTRLARALANHRFAYPGRSDTIKASVHVDELLRAACFLDSAQRERRSGPLFANVAYPQASTIREICETFRAVGGLPRPLGTVPKQLVVLGARVAARLQPRGDVAPLRVEKLLTSTNLYPAELVNLGYRFATDLRAAIQLWYEAEPYGQFV